MSDADDLMPCGHPEVGGLDAETFDIGKPDWFIVFWCKLCGATWTWRPYRGLSA